MNKNMVNRPLVQKDAPHLHKWKTGAHKRTRCAAWIGNYLDDNGSFVYCSPY